MRDKSITGKCEDCGKKAIAYYRGKKVCRRCWNIHKYNWEKI